MRSLAALLLLASCASAPDCPLGEHVDALPAPFDQFEAATDDALFCNHKGSFLVYHAVDDDRDAETLAEVYRGGVGDMRHAGPADTHLDESIFGGPSGEPVLAATADHIYLLQLVDDHYNKRVKITLEDKSDARADPRVAEAAQKASAHAKKLQTLAKQASGACPSGGVDADVLHVSAALLADLVRNRGGTSAVRNQAIAEALVSAPVVALTVRTDHTEPVVDVRERTFTPGRQTWKLVLIDNAAGAALCTASYTATNEGIIDTIEWSDGGSNAKQAVRRNLDEQVIEARAKALDAAVAGELTEAGALTVDVDL